MKKIVAIMMAAIMLAGCSGGKETTWIGKGNANGVSAEVEIISNGDKISKQKDVLSMDLKTLGLTEAQAKETMQPTVEKNSALEGVSVKVDIKEDKAIFTTEIDYNKADVDELKKVGLLDSVNDNQYVSLKVTKENYEKTFGMVFEEK